MLTIWGDRQRYCDGVNRRNFLRLGAFGAGLTLADVLRIKAAQDPAAVKTSSQKAAIMIYLPGGPSHMDMYDLKPEAPIEFRGEFKPIATNVPGVQICEHMPRQARMWDKLACVRSIVANDEHSDSYVMTGYTEQVNRTAAHPSFGSVLSKLRGGGDGRRARRSSPFAAAARSARSRATWASRIGRSRRAVPASKTSASSTA